MGFNGELPRETLFPDAGELPAPFHLTSNLNATVIEVQVTQQFTY